MESGSVWKGGVAVEAGQPSRVLLNHKHRLYPSPEPRLKVLFDVGAFAHETLRICITGTGGFICLLSKLSGLSFLGEAKSSVTGSPQVSSVGFSEAA